MNLKSIFTLSVYTETSPNMQWDDIWMVIKTLLTPWSWKNINYSEEFRQDLAKYTGLEHIILTDSGRTALNVILKAINIKSGDEVILPSFTCLVVANAVRWTGAKPIYLDTSENDFNADFGNLDKLITSNTKAILVQHTFGKMVDVDKVRAICKFKAREDIVIIEDWAHTMKRGQELKGDVAFLTFGIEKLISTIRGGAAVTNNQQIADAVSQIVNDWRDFPIKRTIIGLLNPLFWWIDVPLHKVGYKRYTLGAAVRIIWRKLGFLGIMIEKLENKSQKPDWYPVKISPALCRLGINQLKKLDTYNRHRSELAQIYHEKLGFLSDEKEFNQNRVYLRYPILLRSEEEKSDTWETAKNLKITLGAWFKSPLYATYVTKEAFEKLCFIPANTPTTVKKCKTVLNLPTSINMPKHKAVKLVNELDRLLNN